MLDLGFVSAILAEKNFNEVIEFASDNNFSCVEIMCWPKGKAERRYAGVTHIDVDNTKESNISEIKSLLKEKNIYISGLGYYPNPLDPDINKSEFYFEHIKKVIRMAKKLGIPVVNTFIGRDPGKNTEDNLKLFKDRWPVIIKFAEENNIKIGIENCPMLFTKDEWPGGKNLATTPAIWEKMFEIIPSRALGLNYDPSHLIWQQMNEIQPIIDFRDRLYHIHLKDVKINRENLNKAGIMAYPLEYHTPKIPGRGDVRWNDFFEALKTAGYQGPVTIEVEDKDFEKSEKDINTALIKSRDFINQFL